MSTFSIKNDNITLGNLNSYVIPTSRNTTGDKFGIFTEVPENTLDITGTLNVNGSLLKNELEFVGEDYSNYADHIRRRTVFIRDNDTRVNQGLSGTGVFVKEKDLFPDSTQDRILVLTAAHVVTYTPFKNMKQPDGSGYPSSYSRLSRIIYFTKDDKMKIAFLRVMGFSPFLDFALCEIIDQAQVDPNGQSTIPSTWYTEENINSVETAEIYRMTTDNFEDFRDGAKLGTAGLTESFDPFSFTEGTIRSTVYMSRKCDTITENGSGTYDIRSTVTGRLLTIPPDTVDVSGNSYLKRNPFYGIYFLYTLNVGPGNSGGGIFLLNNGIKLCGIHSFGIKEDNQTSSLGGGLHPLILNSTKLFGDIISYYENNNYAVYQVPLSFMNLNIIQPRQTAFENTTSNIMTNMISLDNIEGNISNGTLDSEAPILTKYTYSGGYSADGPSSLTTDRYLIYKIESLDNSGQVVNTYEIGNELDKTPLFHIFYLENPNTYLRIYFFGSLDASSGVEHKTEIVKLDTLPSNHDCQTYTLVYLRQLP